MGHLIGLDHSGDSDVMAPSVGFCENRTLNADDTAGRDALYDCILSEPPPPACDNDGVCELGEDCRNCPSDCAGLLKKKPTSRFCCGDGVPQSAEGDGTICNGNF